VGVEGLEPPSLAAQDPKSCVSANFTTRPLKNMGDTGLEPVTFWV
jgi:hypothetical protein